METIASLNDPAGRIALLANHEARIVALQEDRKRQNGTLDRLEEKMDSLIFRMLAATAAFALASLGWVLVLLKH